MKESTPINGGSEEPAFATWDIPVRVFHWTMVVAVAVSWGSHEFDAPEVHLWSGYTVIVMVCTRIIWGFCGSRHARFSDFLRGPATVLAYWRGELPTRPGHNPAGGWSVIMLLTLLLAQALTGLFNSDGLLFDGPFYYAIDGDVADRVGTMHEYLFWGLSTFVTIHVLAVLYYQFKRHSDIITPMLTGGAEGNQATRSVWLALALLLLCAGCLAIALTYAPEPDLPW